MEMLKTERHITVPNYCFVFHLLAAFPCDSHSKEENGGAGVERRRMSCSWTRCLLNRRGEGLGQFMDVHQRFIECQAALLSANATKNKITVVSVLLSLHLEGL